MLTLFLCFVAFAAVGQATYTCPRHAVAEKLYAPRGRVPRAAPLSNHAPTNAPTLVMISGGLEDNPAQIQKDESIRLAA